MSLSFVVFFLGNRIILNLKIICKFYYCLLEDKVPVFLLAFQNFLFFI